MSTDDQPRRCPSCGIFVVPHRRKAHPRTEETGWRLANVVAPDVAQALEVLGREIGICDGFSRGAGDGRGGSAIANPTLGSALAAGHLERSRDNLHDAIDGVDAAVHHLGEMARRLLGMQAPADVPRCKDGQVGKDAPLWPSSDLHCMELPDKAGLCTKHYFQWYRYRIAHDIDTSRDFEPGVAS